MDDNKVLFGLKNIHFVEYTQDENGAAELGDDPYHLSGAVKMGLDPKTGEVTFRADDIDYYVDYSDNGYDMDLEMAQFPDDFKTRFLNYVPVADGGVAQVKTKKKKKVAIMFEGKGDALHRRGILYNVTLGAVKRDHETTGDTNEPKTATMSCKVSGDPKTGIVKTSFKQGAAGYDDIFTDPPLPELPTVYTLTTDSSPVTGKTYYNITATAVTNPDPAALPIYYEKSGTSGNETYALTEDTSLNATKTYYTLTGTAVATPTTPATNKYYEASQLDLS